MKNAPTGSGRFCIYLIKEDVMAMVKLNHNFNLFIEPKYYADILLKNDEAGSVLKLQLIAERFLEVYLDERIPTHSRKFFEKGKKGELLKYFDEKLMVAVAFGLPVELADALKKLNKVRNDFGHDFDRELSALDLDAYIQSVELFNIDVGQPFAGSGPIRTTIVKSDQKTLRASDSFVTGFVIATFCLMTRAGLWLVNDLNSRGQLKTEPDLHL
jgi:hypothetical protein